MITYRIYFEVNIPLHESSFGLASSTFGVSDMANCIKVTMYVTIRESSCNIIVIVI
jgi:hypothetical protein